MFSRKKQLEKEARGRGINKRGRVAKPTGRSRVVEPSTISSDVSNELVCNSDNDVICPLCFSKEDRVWPWIACDHCEVWYHCECTDISPNMYPDLHAIEWFCSNCV